MDGMSYALIVLHWALAFTTIGYCFLRQRPVDFCSIGALGCVLYTSAGFTGSVNVPLGLDGSMSVVALLPETQAILCVIMVLPLVAAVIHDTALPRRNQIAPAVSDRSNVIGLAWMTAFLGVATIATTGSALFLESKIEMMKGLPAISQLWVASSTILTVVAWVHQHRPATVFAGLNMLLILVVGFRSPVVIACLAIFALTFNRAPLWKFARSRWPQVLLVLFGIHLVAQFEGIRADLLTGNLVGSLQRLYALGSTADLIANSEFQGQAGILNTVVYYDYRIQEPYLLDGIVKQLTFTSISEEGKTRSYNDFFQTDLFPNLSWGYASFFFAEAWSNAGWLGIAACSIGFVCLMLLFSLSLRVDSLLWRSGLAVMGTFACFYLHRNSIITLLSIERRVFVLTVAAAVLAAVLARGRVAPTFR